MEMILLLSLLGIGAAAAFGGGDGSSGNGSGNDDGGNDDAGGGNDGGGDDGATPRELMRGTDGDDVMNAGQDQTLRGLSGDDTLEGDSNAMVYGDTGADRIEVFDNATGYGGFGDDTLWGHDASTIYGGEGDDFVGAIDGSSADGGAGDDEVQWYATAEAPSGHSVLIRGGEGNDTVRGWDQDDGLVTLAGGTGNDLVIARDGNLGIGSFGEDTLIGTSGASLTGGEGDDLFVVSLSPGPAPSTEDAVTIRDFVKDSDRIVVDLSQAVESLTLAEVDGDTVLSFGWLNPVDDTPLQQTVRLQGVTGLTLQDFEFSNPFESDEIYDGPVIGSEGADVLTAPAGEPLMLLGDGNDTVTAGADVTGGLITLGDGNDIYTGTGALADVFGGMGNDTLTYTTGGAAPSAAVGINGGSGDDVIAIVAGAAGGIAGDGAGLDIDLGSGNDSLIVGKDVDDPIFVYDGEGDDNVTIWLGQTVFSEAGADNLTINVDADHLATRAPSTVIDLGATDSLVIQFEAGIPGTVTIVADTDSDIGEPRSALKIDGKTVVSFVGTVAVNDPRITITRDAVFA